MAGELGCPLCLPRAILAATLVLPSPALVERVSVNTRSQPTALPASHTSLEARLGLSGTKDALKSKALPPSGRDTLTQICNPVAGSVSLDGAKERKRGQKHREGVTVLRAFPRLRLGRASLASTPGCHRSQEGTGSCHQKGGGTDKRGAPFRQTHT